MTFCFYRTSGFMDFATLYACWARIWWPMVPSNLTFRLLSIKFITSRTRLFTSCSESHCVFCVGCTLICLVTYVTSTYLLETISILLY